MKTKRPEIILDGIQIKSLEAFRKLAGAVNTIEETCGIHEVTITMKDVFFCPWIDIESCRGTHMERLLISLLEKLDK